MKSFREYSKIRENNMNMQGGYGPTGNPAYPYHPQFGRDPNYPVSGNEDQNEIKRLITRAEDGYKALHDLAGYIAIHKKDNSLIIALDKFAELLQNNSHIFLGGKQQPYRQY